MRSLYTAFLLLLCSCGYHAPNHDVETISVPYIEGDVEGQFTDALVRELSSTGAFEYRRNEGNLTLKVTLVTNDNEPIGYRYDRKSTTGQRLKNLMPVESRRIVKAEVYLIEAASQDIIIGPCYVTATADYDYVDPNSIRDLSFTDTAGATQTSIGFSLGQLDAKEGALDDATHPLAKNLAKKIMEGIIGQTKY